MVVAKALKNVNIIDEVNHFEATLQRDGGVYVSTLPQPLLIQTPSITVSSDLVENEEPATFANLKMKHASIGFFKEVENAIVQHAIDQKASWFREDIADETITQSLRSFIDEETRTLRVRLADTITAYDASKHKIELPPPGTRVKCVLELARITFSKTQFGAVWNLKQVRLVEDTGYLFEEEAIEGIVEDMNESILAADDGNHDEELASDIA